MDPYGNKPIVVYLTKGYERLAKLLTRNLQKELKSDQIRVTCGTAPWLGAYKGVYNYQINIIDGYMDPRDVPQLYQGQGNKLMGWTASRNSTDSSVFVQAIRDFSKEHKCPELGFPQNDFLENCVKHELGHGMANSNNTNSNADIHGETGTVMDSPESNKVIQNMTDRILPYPKTVLDAIKAILRTP